MAKQSAYNPITTGVGIEKQDLINNVNTPNQHDENAKLFGDIGGSLGQRPRGWAALASGVAKGLEYGERSKSTAKKQESLDKYNRVMDYFRTQNMEMEKRLQWERQKEQEAAILRPYAVGGMEISYSGMPYEQGNQAMRNVFEQLKVNNPKIKGDYLGYVPNSPLINIRDENGKDTVVSLSNFAGEDVSKRIQGDYIDRQKVAQIPQNQDIKITRNTLMQDRIDQNEVKMYRDVEKEINPKIQSSQQFLEIVPKMEKILNDYPDIFQSAADAVWRDDEKPGMAKNIIRDLQTKWNPEKIKALTSMIKYINKMTLDVTNGFARPNMFIEKIGSKAVPNLNMTADGFRDILYEMRDEKTKELEDYKTTLSQYSPKEKNKFFHRSDKGSNVPAQSKTQAQPNKELSGNTVTIIDPETGQTQQIDEAYLDSAIAGGWEQAQNG